jgi:Raf kinase inhibitor-like YbhB/YbcL family protein
LRLDCLPIGGLHLETDSYPMLPQEVDGFHNIVCSVKLLTTSSPKGHYCGKVAANPRMASIDYGFRQWKEMRMNARWIGRILRGFRAGERHSASNHAALFGVPEVISLKSEWFLNGKQMPLRSAGRGVGENISPPLSWSGVPAGTVELAILMEDPDAPLPRPFVHMIAYRISPDKSSVVEGTLANEAIGVAFGRGTAGAQGYKGPRPVPGHGPHRYIFQILALSRRTAFSSVPKLKAFLAGISGTVMGRGMLVGTYERP